MADEAQKATFEAMYATHVRDVLAYCLRRTGPTAAHDATAEVFTVAWRRVAELPGQSEILPWLYGVAANVVRNERRSTRRARNLVNKIEAQEAQVEPFQPGPETQVVRRSEYEEVHRAIDSLKPKYREVIKLVEWEELPRDQVAELLGVSRATIDQRMHRAYRQLERPLKHLSHEAPSTKGGEHDAAPAS